MKSAVIVIALPVLAIVLYSLLSVLSLSIFPLLAALFQSFKLLNYIDKNKAFSDGSVEALKKIKQFASSIAALHLLSFPLYFIVGEVDDAPGVILVGLMFISAPTVVAVFAADLQKLLRNALDIKRDNDLTI